MCSKFVNYSKLNSDTIVFNRTQEPTWSQYKQKPIPYFDKEEDIHMSMLRKFMTKKLATASILVNC